jgi:hypothetical protein
MLSIRLADTDKARKEPIRQVEIRGGSDPSAA